MRTTFTAIMFSIGTLAIAASAGAAGTSRVVGFHAEAPGAVAGLLPKPTPSPFISPRLETASLEMQPPKMWVTAPRATIQIIATPRLRVGYPYFAEMTMDGVVTHQRLISSPMSALLESVIVVDGTPHQACATMRRMGEPSMVVAQRCFDVQIGTMPQTE